MLEEADQKEVQIAIVLTRAWGFTKELTGQDKCVKIAKKGLDNRFNPI
jgi:hypothetical protein